MEHAGQPELSPEAQQEVRLFGIIGHMQHHVANALRYEERLRLAALEARQSLSRFEGFVAYHEQGNEHAPGGHNHIILGPQHGEEAIEGIIQLDLRVPQLVPLDNPDTAMDMPQWNDVFIELHTTDGAAQDFLLNGQGMRPFFDATKDIKEILTYDLRPDLYTVSNAQPKLPEVTVTLEGLDKIMSTYIYQPQYRQGGPHLGMHEAS